MKFKALFEDSQDHIIYQDEIGFIKGHLRPDGYWWIEKFYINPEFRGKGFAKKLAEHMPKKAKLLAQPLKVKGETVLDREPLINFYKSLGFIETPDSNDNMYMVRESLLTEHLKKVDGKWALVSKTNGRVLRYYHGEGKPSQEWVSKIERQIHAFEGVVFCNSLNEEIEFVDSKLPNGSPIIRFTDELGGSGFLTVKDGVASIIDWHSVPREKRYSDEESNYKGRGFAINVILAIKHKLHINTVKISMPSIEARQSLNKMVEKGILKPHEDSKIGISTDQYHTVFDIN